MITIYKKIPVDNNFTSNLLTYFKKQYEDDDTRIFELYNMNEIITLYEGFAKHYTSKIKGNFDLTPHTILSYYSSKAIENSEN